jgi:hypothetical protein
MHVAHLGHTSPQSVNIKNWMQIETITGLRKINVTGGKIPGMLQKEMEFLITLYATLIRVRNSGRHPHSASTSDP